ncbi:MULTISPECIES: TM2 domain-containing protein [unclassified Gordonia (in: high G+C Gram-positive bacteria)]|uniref:TM2 domain-containing protein n=1 Tax=unclassified Gordonia (in: high G+C Gram-positive bacteria) TaxID=2657482 RepID=UPI001FFEC697|nr:MULTISPECIES: TM2 domain-containing protein [unclassified Gordonia (in: high G+C Gram-positive bacteria)]UQE74363.1 NINE protein [Gordonia sp. PP30]
MTYPNGPQQPGTPANPYGAVYGAPAAPAQAVQPYGAPQYPAQQPYPVAQPVPPVAPYGGAPGYPYGTAPGYPAAPYGTTPYGMAGYGGVDPYTGMAMSDKSKMTAGLLQFFLGGFGAGRFYLGYNGFGAAQLCLTLGGWFFLFIGMFLFVPLIIAFPMLIGVWVWAFVDAIMMFTGNVTDVQGRKLQS